MILGAIDPRKIVELRVEQNEVTFNAEHTNKLTNILEVSRSLHSLDLSMNVVGDEQLIKLSPVFSGLKTLKVLKMSECKLTIRGLA